jgi:hypothetical protein
MQNFEPLSKEEEKLWMTDNGFKEDYYDAKCEICGVREYAIVKPPKPLKVEIWVWEGECYNVGKSL